MIGRRMAFAAMAGVSGGMAKHARRFTVLAGLEFALPEISVSLELWTAPAQNGLNRPGFVRPIYRRM